MTPAFLASKAFFSAAIGPASESAWKISTVPAPALPILAIETAPPTQINVMSFAIELAKWVIDSSRRYEMRGSVFHPRFL